MQVAAYPLSVSYSGGPHIRFPCWGEGVHLDLRFRGPLEAKSVVRGPKIDPPGAQGRVFDLRYRSCGFDRRCTQPFYIPVSGLDQELATKWSYNCASGLSLGASCTILRAWPVKRGPGANFGPKPPPRQKTKTKMSVFLQRLNRH